MERVPILRNRVQAWQRIHPFDKQYGIQTSGFVPVEKLGAAEGLESKINPYAGSQPSLIRSAISALGNLEEYSFIDLGCGKGRALVVASEFQFREIVGIEISPHLTEVARRNLAKIRHRFPARPPVTVLEGNAAAAVFPKGKLALLLYHSFGEELVSQLIARLETHLASGGEHTFLAYCNPVHGHLVDASPAFTRWCANVVPHHQSELGFGPDSEDTVIVWQSVSNSLPSPHPDINRAILVNSAWRAELAAPQSRTEIG